MFDVGEILLIDAPITDHRKYHLSLGVNEHLVTVCLYLNSENKYADNIEFDCADFEMLPESKTGKTVVSLTALPRYNDRQLRIFRAQSVGWLDKAIAAQIAAHSLNAKALTAPERAFVAKQLYDYAAS